MGYLLMFIGLGILLFTIYLGYTFYQSNIYQAMLKQSSNRLQTMGVLQSLINMISSSKFFYSVIAIVLLLIMVSIGFRLIRSGTKIMALKLETEKKDDFSKKRER